MHCINYKYLHYLKNNAEILCFIIVMNSIVIFYFVKKLLINWIFNYVTGSSAQAQYQIGRINVQSYL